MYCQTDKNRNKHAKSSKRKIYGIFSYSYKDLSSYYYYFIFTFKLASIEFEILV